MTVMFGVTCYRMSIDMRAARGRHPDQGSAGSSYGPGKEGLPRMVNSVRSRRGVGRYT